MSTEKKQRIRFTLTPTVEIIEEETRSFWSRSASEFEKPVVVTPQLSKSISYTPPDTLMYPLFSAIQRKDWKRAKKLCRELVLCDPERNMYHELYVRLEQITNLINQRLHPPSAVSQEIIANNDNDGADQQYLQ